jgi:hypothetical protein
MELSPKLTIECSARYHLSERLTICHNNKLKTYSLILNMVVFLLFIGVFGIGLYCNRKKKLSPYDKHLKDIKEQEYVLTKIRHHQIEKKRRILQ